jgi:hypothetical protein
LRLKLQRQRREIDEKLRALELVESLLAGSELAMALRQPELIASGTFQDPSTRYKAVSLREACKDVLATQGDWYSTNGITDAIKAGGFPFASGTPGKRVHNIVTDAGKERSGAQKVGKPMAIR